MPPYQRRIQRALGDPIALVGGIELFGGVFSDCLEHGEAAVITHPEETPIDQRTKAVEVRAADRLRGLDRRSISEYG